jgi:hypothetical protein
VFSGTYPTLFKVDQNPSITISSKDPNRYIGEYVIEMQDLSINSNASVQTLNVQTFTISIIRRLPRVTTGGDYVYPDESINVLSFGAIFALSLVFSLVLSYTIRRMRQRAILERMAAFQNMPPASNYGPKYVPVLHSAILDLPSDVYVGKSRASTTKQRVKRGEDGSSMNLLRNGIVGFLNLLSPNPHPLPASTNNLPQDPNNTENLPLRQQQSTTLKATSRSPSSGSLAANAALGVKTMFEKLVKTNSSSNLRKAATSSSGYDHVTESARTSQVSKPIEMNEKGFEHVELQPISKQILKSSSFVENEENEEDQGKLKVKKSEMNGMKLNI